MIGLGHALSHSLAPQGAVRGFVGALDGYLAGMAECWSHRRLLVSEPVTDTLLQVRRTSDDAPMDVPALPNGELNSEQLLSFAGGSSAAVAVLKGQVNGLDFHQNASDEQRMIVDAGTLVTVGGKAASRGLSVQVYPGAPSTGGILKTNPFTEYTGNKVSLFLRGAHGIYGGVFNGIVDSYFCFGRDGSSASQNHPAFSHLPDGGIQVTWISNISGGFNSDYLLSCIFDGSDLTIRDGTNTYIVPASPTFDFNKFIIGAYDDLTNSSAASANRIQEAAVWYLDQTDNESDIRAALLA